MLTGLAWTLDRVATAQARAGFAHDVAVPVNDGHDIREVTLTVLRGAMQEVTSFPGHLLSNGAGNAHRHEDIVTAVAAGQFAREVVASMMFDQVPAGLLA